MHPKQFSLVAGILLLAMGLTAFIPALSWNGETLPPLHLDTSYGLYLGIFPLNVINKVALVFFGVGGLLAYFSKNALPASVRVARWMAAIMIPAAILGLIPQTQTVFGYWPLFGAEVAAHGFFGLLGAYFGWALPTKAQHRIEPLVRSS